MNTQYFPNAYCRLSLFLIVLVLTFLKIQASLVFPTNSTAIKIVDHNIVCNSTFLGTLRYRDYQLEICNGTEYVSVCGNGNVGELGSESNPAESCLDIMANRK